MRDRTPAQVFDDLSASRPPRENLAKAELGEILAAASQATAQSLAGEGRTMGAVLVTAIYQGPTGPTMIATAPTVATACGSLEPEAFRAAARWLEAHASELEESQQRQKEAG